MNFAEEVLRDAPQAAADQTSLYLARQRQLQAQTSVLQAQAEQRTHEIAEMKSRQRQVQRSLKLAREERSITAPLVRNGVVARIELLRIERQVSDLEGEIIARSQPDLGKAS